MPRAIPKCAASGPAVGLVLPGGAARGAYEIGVRSYLLDDVARSLGRPVRPEIVCGTSVGAINACALAAYADDGATAARRLTGLWSSLRVGALLRPDGLEVLSMLCGLVCRRPLRRARGGPGGLLDTAMLGKLLTDAVPFSRIGLNLRRGLLRAVAVTATRVATGHTVVFVQQAGGVVPHWPHEPTLSARAARLQPEHALASAAIPLLFPPVRIDGALYCEGGLRQNVPLVPALRLGADRLIVVSPHRMVASAPNEEVNEAAFTDPLFLIGKMLNALLLDRIDNDADRLTQVNDILTAGCRRFGRRFIEELNDELGRDERAVRPIDAVVVRASRELGSLAVDVVRSPAFARRAGGVVARVLRRLADAGAAAEADLLSYLLFDGEYAGRLIELGRADARAQHEELCRVLDGAAEDARAARA